MCGVWKVMPAEKSPSTSAKPILELACNLANAVETDLRTPELLKQQTVPPQLASAWFSRPTWFYLVVLAWLTATIEWFLYQRRYLS